MSCQSSDKDFLVIGTTKHQSRYCSECYKNFNADERKENERRYFVSVLTGMDINTLKED